MRRNPERSHRLFPGLVLLALLLFLVPEEHVSSARGRAYSALSPVLRLFHAAQPRGEPQPALIVVPAPAPAPQAAEAAEPPRENHAVELDFLRSENIRLRDQMARIHHAGLDTALAQPAGIEADVIARNVLWQEPMLGLNRGEADGVRLHAGVLHCGAVVGRIVSVGPRASCMAMLTHRGISIAARLSESRVEGVLQGALPAAKGSTNKEPRDDSERLCRMSVIGREVNVKIGEHVVTSGHDGAFPRGLWLGVVTAAAKKGDVQWELSVRPACTENAVECVRVLNCETPEVPWPVRRK